MLHRSRQRAFADRHAPAGAVGGAARQGHQVDRPRDALRVVADMRRRLEGDPNCNAHSGMSRHGHESIGSLGLALAAFFAGAAVYVSFVEQPARLLLDNRSLLVEWQNTYPAGMRMQGTLAIVAGLAGIWTAWVVARLALAARRRADARQLALHAHRAHADQPRADGARAGRGERLQPRADRAVGHAACRSQRSRHPGDAAFLWPLATPRAAAARTGPASARGRT